MGKLNGKVAVVTGAASGIGRGIAVAFAAEGADIAVVDIAGREQAASVLAEIAALGRGALFVRCDVSRENDVRTMAREVLGQFGRVDILVNNAGIFTRSEARAGSSTSPHSSARSAARRSRTTAPARPG